MGLPLMSFVSSSSSALGSTTSSSFSSLGLRGAVCDDGVYGVAARASTASGRRLGVDVVPRRGRTRPSRRGGVFGASGGELEAGGAALKGGFFHCFCAAVHLSLGISITLNVGAGVASAGASAASARSRPARGARTVHFGASKPAAPARQSASTILCILAWLVLATGARTPRLLRDLGCAGSSVSTPQLCRGQKRRRRSPRNCRRGLPRSRPDSRARSF